MWYVRFNGYTYGPYPWKEARAIWNIAMRRELCPDMWEANDNVHTRYARL